MRGHHVSRKAAAKKKAKSRVARIPKRNPPPPPQFVQPIAIERISDWDREIHDTFELMRQKINALESQVAQLRSVIAVSNGDVSIQAQGNLSIFAWREINILSEQSLDLTGVGSARLQSWGDVVVGNDESGNMEINAGGSIDMTCGAVNMNAGICEAEGVFECVTLFATEAVIAPYYAPGKGNQW